MSTSKKACNFSSEEIFPVAKNMGSRVWGEETLLVVSPGKYTLKKLFIQKGKMGGLQYHHIKDESAYLISGKLKITYDLGDGKLLSRVIGSGQHFRFPTGVVHQEEAIEDCLLIEASTPHANDRVRVEKNYGMIDSNQGLPSTNLNDVITY